MGAGSATVTKKSKDSKIPLPTPPLEPRPDRIDIQVRCVTQDPVIKSHLPSSSDLDGYTICVVLL